MTLGRKFLTDSNLFAAASDMWARDRGFLNDRGLVRTLFNDTNLAELTDPIQARINLGLRIGHDVQAHSANLDMIAASMPPTEFGLALLSKPTANEVILALGNAFPLQARSTNLDRLSSPVGISDLTLALVPLNTGTEWRGLLGAGTVNSITLSGGTTGLTVSGGTITTSGTLTLGGTLSPANGGTGVTSLSALRTALNFDHISAMTDVDLSVPQTEGQVLSWHQSTNKWTPVTVPLAALDTDPTLATNSDARVSSQRAVKLYVDNAVTSALKFMGSINASTNPNYPAATKGACYVITTAGLIGGASGASVDAGDMILAIVDNAGGTQATVGTSWTILEHNLSGALLGFNNLSDLSNKATARTNLGLVIGTDVQAYSATLATLAGLSTTTFGRSLLTSADAPSIRTLLGLGSLAAINDAASDGVIYGRQNGAWVAAGSASRNLDSLSDVDTTTVVPTNGQALIFNSTSSLWVPGTVSGGGSALTVQDEGTSLSTAVTSLNFVGSGVTATNTGGAVTVTVPGSTGGGGTTGTASISARYWRVRAVSYNPTTGGNSVGWGVCLAAFRNASNAIISTGGTPISNVPDAGGWTMAAAFNGSSASNNGWYNQNTTSGIGAWLGYDFGTAVTPAKFEMAALNGYPQLFISQAAIDYSSDGISWNQAGLVNFTAPATGVTVQQIAVPNTTVISGTLVGAGSSILGPNFKTQTYGGTSSGYGTTVNQANESIVGAVGQRIEIEALLHKTAGGTATVFFGDGSNGYGLSLQGDGNIVVNRLVAGVANLIGASGTSAENDHTGIYAVKVVVNIKGASSHTINFFVDGMMFPTPNTAPYPETAFNLVGATLRTALSTDDITKCYARARVVDPTFVGDIAGTGASFLTVKDEGTTLTSGAASLNFVGPGVTATVSGTDVTVTVASGGSSSWSRNSYTATAGQTSFSTTYTVGSLEVFLNGVLLNGADYTATDGATIVLASAAAVGDILEAITLSGSTAATSGTAFPSTPTAGQKFFRTDRGLDYYYDGTRWLTVELFTELYPVKANSYGVGATNIGIPYGGLYDIWSVGIDYWGVVTSSTPASNYSYTSLRTYDGTTDAQVVVVSQQGFVGGGVWNNTSAATGVVIAKTNKLIYAPVVTVVGSPGAGSIDFRHRYRLIG